MSPRTLPSLLLLGCLAVGDLSATEITWPTSLDRSTIRSPEDYLQPTISGKTESATFGMVREDGKIATRAREVFGKAMDLLRECHGDGMVAAIGRGRFGDVKRAETGGKGLDGVLEKAPDYFNPFLEIMEAGT